MTAPAAALGTAARERSSGNDARTGCAIILLVEDDPMVAGMLRDRLGAGGHTVWHAASRAEAEAIGNEIAPDLVIVDLALPDANGYRIAGSYLLHCDGAAIHIG